MAEHRLTPKPKLCVKCGEAQPDTKDWFGEAVCLKVVKDELVAALELCAEGYKKSLDRFLEKGIKFERRPSSTPPRGDDEKWEEIAFWIYTDLAEVSDQARVALAHAKGGQS